MKRNYIALILVLLLLTGCTATDSNSKFKKSVNQKSASNCYDSDYSSVLLEDKSDEFKSLENRLYSSLKIESMQITSSDSFEVEFSTDSLENMQKFALKDENGFISDLLNLLSLKSSDIAINNYVYNYFSAVDCNERQHFTVTLVPDKANGVFIDNSPVVNYLCNYIDTVTENTINFITEMKVEHNDSIAEVYYTEYGLDDLFVLTFYDKKGAHPVTIKFTDIKSGKDAEDAICSLSENNKRKDFGMYKLYYYTYEVTNYSNDAIIFENNFAVYNNFCKLDYESLNYFGLTPTISVTPGETAIVKCACVGMDNCSLIWCADSVNLAYGIKLSK